MGSVTKREDGEYRPRSLRELMADMGLQYQTILLSCVYCSKTLEVSELVTFSVKDLQIIWRGGFPYGVCAFCLEFYLKIQYIRHYRRSASIKTVEEELQRPVGNLNLRCFVCAIKLHSTDYATMEEQGLNLKYIAGQWRGKCMICNGAVEGV